MTTPPVITNAAAVPRAARAATFPRRRPDFPTDARLRLNTDPFLLIVT